MAGGITLLAAECVAPPLLRVALWPVHPFAEAPLVRLGDQLRSTNLANARTTDQYVAGLAALAHGTFIHRR
jgi:hypothetical protein